MPLGIELNAAAGRVSGEYLVSGKVVSYAGAIALFALTFALTRRISRSWPLSLALVGTILVTNAGFIAVHGIRGDTLPATLQLGAIALVLTYSTPAVALAGLLCALAFVAKFSALWALAAIALWLFIQRRPQLLALFLGTSIVATASLLLVFDAVSDGRMIDNVYTLSFAGTSGSNLLVESSRHFFEVTSFGGVPSPACVGFRCAGCCGPKADPLSRRFHLCARRTHCYFQRRGSMGKPSDRRSGSGERTCRRPLEQSGGR